MDRANPSNLAVVESSQLAAGVIRLEEADSLALRDLTRRLLDAQADAQLAAERAKLAITEVIVERQRLVRTLADRYHFDETIAHDHDSASHTLARTAADSTTGSVR